MHRKILKKKWLKKDGKNYSYWVYGNKNKDTLLILPGFSGTHEDQLPFVRNLTAVYKIIIPDYPGWGSAPPLSKANNLDNYALHINNIISKEKIKKITVLGHCMGASLAIEFASRHQSLINKLFLISTPYTDGSMIYKWLAWMSRTSIYFPKSIRPLFYLWRSRIINTILSPFVLKFKSRKKKLRYIIDAWDRSGEKEEIVEENWISLLHFDFNKIKSIKTPIHLIFGEKDLIINKDFAHKFHALTPQATINFILQAGHLPPIETPQTLARLILKLRGQKALGSLEIKS